MAILTIEHTATIQYAAWPQIFPTSDTNIFLIWVAFLFSCIGILVYASDALQLEGLSTKKPRTTKYSSKVSATVCVPRLNVEFDTHFFGFFFVLNHYKNY